MSILLMLLKVAAFLLLALVILAITGSMLVLFCPVHYLLEGERMKKNWIRARFFWLFHLFDASFSYEDDLVYGKMHFFGIKKTFSMDLSQTEEDTKEKIKEAVQKEIKGSSINRIILQIKDILKSIKRDFKKIKKMFADEKNQQAVQHLKKELFLFVKIFLPKKSKVNVQFSTGSPDTTGQLYGVMACFPIMYQESNQILPDFASDEPYWKGSFWGKGRIYGFQLLGILIRIILDKNCRRLHYWINKWIQSNKYNPTKKEKNAEGN